MLSWNVVGRSRSALLAVRLDRHQPLARRLPRARRCAPIRAAAADLALYDGVYFESHDGMLEYKEIVIVPRLLKSQVAIELPDGGQIDAKDLSLELLKEHGVECDLDGDDGRGNYFLLASGIGGDFIEGKASRITIFSDNSRPGPIAIQLRGKKIVVPIERSELEALLGPPDEIRLKTFPEPQ